MSNGVVTTISGMCKRCYSCIRNCPVKAIKVEDEQARVVPELCISCGHCVTNCSQNAKQISSGIESVGSMLEDGQAVFACLAPSFVAYYQQVDPAQVIGALKELGFAQVWEVAWGAELVTSEYKDMIMETRDGQPCISTTCPAVVTLVEKYYPDLIGLLAPVVSPMIAVGRLVKQQYGENTRVVFIGPCIAKKGEARDPMVRGAVDEVLTFAELDEMLFEAGVDVDQAPVGKWDSPAPGLSRLYPVSSGILSATNVTLDPLNLDVIAVEGRTDCVTFLDSLSRGESLPRFVDMLFCKGCINGPIIPSGNDLIKRQMVVKYANDNVRSEQEVRDIKLPVIDLQRGYINQSKKLPQPTEAQISAILASMSKFSPQDELNCGACGYDTCHAKAIAAFQGLADNNMCLPLLINRLKSVNTQLRKQLVDHYGVNNMVGNSQEMLTIYRLIDKIAPTDSTVLIRGESGTGKDLVAQALHEKSLRSDKIYLSINCAALPENLLESELFGYARGAFTGAVGEKKGLLEEANGGTLFLDEIGDCSLNLQVKLLRVLQQKEYLRVGDTIPRQCDVRIVAATNQNLVELIKQKKFREDLYYRLNVLSIFLPSLRERCEDIPILAMHFLDKFNKKHGKEIYYISREAMAYLVSYNWPGNVRELENAIERAAILCEGIEIQTEDLPAAIRDESAAGISTKRLDPNLNYKQSVENYKKELITEALSRSDGVQAKAADLLGMGRSTLHELIKRLDIEVD